MSTPKHPLALVSLDPDLIDLVEEMDEYDLVGVFEKNPDCDTSGVAHLGSDENWTSALNRFPDLQVAMAVDPPDLKASLVGHYGLDNMATVIAQDAVVSSRASVGTGCIVQRGVKILRNARIGYACKLNIDAAVHHDSVVGNCCTLAPGCRLLGSVVIGDRVFVGAGAIVLPRMQISSDVVIGAGAVVTKDVPPGTSVSGLPARSTR